MRSDTKATPRSGQIALAQYTDHVQPHDLGYAGHVVVRRCGESH